MILNIYTPYRHLWYKFKDSEVEVVRKEIEEAILKGGTYWFSTGGEGRIYVPAFVMQKSVIEFVEEKSKDE